jgi:hypothetical protein
VLNEEEELDLKCEFQGALPGRGSSRLAGVAWTRCFNAASSPRLRCFGTTRGDAISLDSSFSQFPEKTSIEENCSQISRKLPLATAIPILFYLFDFRTAFGRLKSSRRRTHARKLHEYLHAPVSLPLRNGSQQPSLFGNSDCTQSYQDTLARVCSLVRPLELHS